jgi:hypothetical protein
LQLEFVTIALRPVLVTPGILLPYNQEQIMSRMEIDFPKIELKLVS